MDARHGRVKWGAGQPRQRTSAAYWRQPLKWNKAKVICDNCGGAFREPCHHYTDDTSGIVCPNIATGYHRPRVFCASLADWLDEVPIEWLADLLALIHATPNLDWLLLTKRPENWLPRMSEAFAFIVARGCGRYPLELTDWLMRWHPAHESWGGGVAKPEPPHNVWIGTTAEDQAMADKRIAELLRIPAKVRFLSCEPLLGPVEFSNVTKRSDAIQQLGKAALNGIHWLICGGESGPHARPMHPDWARSLRDQCAAAGVPFLFKQWGEWCQGHNDDLKSHVWLDGVMVTRFGKRAAGRKLDGVFHLEFPRA